jgi:protocatechuate 3,4-dioxygenase, beta subunit
MYINSLLLSVILLFSCLSHAQKPVDGLIADCSVTPYIKNLENKPKEFNSTNNLRRKTGSFMVANGENIVIFGRIMDKNCVPVLDAKIEIWQANQSGVYQSSNAKHYKKTSSIDPNFVGSGTTYSNNLGRFDIVTIKPGSRHHSAPHVNLRITHKDLGVLETRIYFAEDNLSNDPTLKKMAKHNVNKLVAIKSPEAQLDESTYTNDTIYLFDIVMNKALKNKRY